MTQTELRQQGRQIVDIGQIGPTLADRVTVTLLDAVEAVDSVQDLHLAPGVSDNIEAFRQMMFTWFRTDAFQQLYRPLAAALIDEWFDGDALVQRTPTARIQLGKGGRSVSFHTDAWYGHGTDVTSVWVPLVEVRGTNSLHMAPDSETSKALLEGIEQDELDLHEINDRAVAICQPIEMVPGQALMFASHMLHGTVENQSTTTRVSFDFRIAADESALGTKPRDNYITRAECESTGDDRVGEFEAPSAPRRALMYSALLPSVSAKSQLIFLAEWARINNVDIVGSESEIVTMSHSPVLRSYVKPGALEHDSVILFNSQLLPSDRSHRQSIYDAALHSGIDLLFAAEGLALTSAADIEAIELAFAGEPTSRP